MTLLILRQHVEEDATDVSLSLVDVLGTRVGDECAEVGLLPK